MSHYITRWCQEHGEWDDDVNSPEEGCPTCIAEGKFQTRADLERENVALREQLSFAHAAQREAEIVVVKETARLAMESGELRQQLTDLCTEHQFADFGDPVSSLKMGIAKLIREAALRQKLTDAESGEAAEMPEPAERYGELDRCFRREWGDDEFVHYHAYERLRTYALAQRERADRLQEQYHDLIMQVGKKHPGESRHDTAKRYIVNAEAPKPGDCTAQVAVVLPDGRIQLEVYVVEGKS